MFVTSHVSLSCQASETNKPSPSPALSVKHLPVGKPSCLGQIPLAGVSRFSSSSPGVTWIPTSTGPDLRQTSGRGGLGDGDPPSVGLSKQALGPGHSLLLCSINTRISPRGKLVWHWPQVSRSLSLAPPTGLAMEPSDASWSAAAEQWKKRNNDQLMHYSIINSVWFIIINGYNNQFWAVTD